MGSLNRHVANERIALVVDTAVGSNADSKGLKSHLKALRKSVGDTGADVTQGVMDFVQQAAKARTGSKRGR
jgi:hypothetical protein